MFKSKIILMVSALAFAIPAVPAMAQDTSYSTPITVTAKHSKTWDKGNKLVQKGIKLRAKADRDHANAERDSARARSVVENARATATNAQREFAQINGSASSFTASYDALAWVKDLDRAASRWDKAYKAQFKGQKAYNKAFRNLRKAQNAQSKADAMISEGRAIMAEAERKSLLTLNDG